MPLFWMKSQVSSASPPSQPSPSEHSVTCAKLRGWFSLPSEEMQKRSLAAATPPKAQQEPHLIYTSEQGLLKHCFKNSLGLVPNARDHTAHRPVRSGVEIGGQLNILLGGLVRGQGCSLASRLPAKHTLNRIASDNGLAQKLQNKCKP